MNRYSITIRGRYLLIEWLNLPLQNEVEKLRSALETSKEDRDKLRGDVAKFK